MSTTLENLTYIGKLERYYSTIRHFKTRMASYVYEPSTLSLFETKALILDKISVLAEAISTQLHFVRENKELLCGQSPSVNYYFQEILFLEKLVIDYAMKIKEFS
ncbi:MAG: hypothetical protein WBB24_14630 [Maribacter sp.]